VILNSSSFAFVSVFFVRKVSWSGSLKFFSARSMIQLQVYCSFSHYATSRGTCSFTALAFSSSLPLPFYSGAYAKLSSLDVRGARIRPESFFSLPSLLPLSRRDRKTEVRVLFEWFRPLFFEPDLQDALPPLSLVRCLVEGLLWD